ncbi:MAG: prolyl oligopeptidase family serine peptidase [Armatimonadota bacterium]
MEIRKAVSVDDMSSLYTQSFNTQSEKAQRSFLELKDRFDSIKLFAAGNNNDGKAQGIGDKKASESSKIIPKDLNPEAIYNIKGQNSKLSSPDGRFLIFLDGESKKYKMFDFQTKEYVCQEVLDKILKEEYELVDFSAKGDSLICFSGGETEPYIEVINGKKVVKKRVVKNDRLYTIDLKTGRKKILTVIKINGMISYSREENAIYIVTFVPKNSIEDNVGSYPRKASLKRVYKVDLSEGSDKTPQIIYESNRRDREITDTRFSHDGRYMAFVKMPLDGKAKNGEVFIYDIKNKKEVKVTENLRVEDIVGWTADSKRLIFEQDVRDNCINSSDGLWMYDIETGKNIHLADGEKFNIEKVLIPRDPGESCIYFVSPAGFYNEVYKIDLSKINSNNPRLPEPELILSKKDGFVSNFMLSGNGDKLYFRADTKDAPKVFMSLDTASGKKEEIVNSNKDFYKQYKMPTQEIKSFKYTAEDGSSVEIEYQVTYPPGYDKNDKKKYPLILMIHGGPNSRFAADIFDGDQPNLMAARGYIVLCPNIRGSDGYGQKHLEAIYSDDKGNNLSSKGYHDLMAALDNLVTRNPGKVDTDRLGVYGFSYGGSTTNYIISQKHPKYRFKAAVSGAGRSTYVPIDERKSFIETHFPGDFTSQEAVANKVYPASPLGALGTTVNEDPGFKTPPLLILHGTDDGTVCFGHSENFYEELIKRKMNVRLLPYEGIGHNILSGKGGFISHYNYLANWFDHFLQPEKEIYDSETYSIYANAGEKRLNRIYTDSRSKRIGNKKSENGKFAKIAFEVEPLVGMLNLDMYKENIVLEDEDGKKYNPVGKLDNLGADKLENVDEKRIYSSDAEKFILVFDIPKEKKEYKLKIKDFPPIRITI